MIKNLYSKIGPLTPAKKILLAGSLVCLFVLAIIWRALAGPADFDSARQITIDQGQSLSGIAKMLESKSVISDANSFVIYAQARGWAGKMQAGEYLIPPHSSLSRIAWLIASGLALNDIQVFIPEGSNIWEIDQRLAEAGLTIAGQFAKAYYLKEGHLFPDTYRFKKGSTMVDIVRKMEDNFNLKSQGLLGVFGSQNLNRAITIASILEKEAKKESDMRLVAGVIDNRLKQGMALQIDATVSYGSCLRKFLAVSLPKNCSVHLEPVGAEIRVDGVFNTYSRGGLPPRPISNPGLMAIQAALEPMGDYLYYLSTRDGSEIIFNKTSAEHAAARRKYLGF